MSFRSPYVRAYFLLLIATFADESILASARCRILLSNVHGASPSYLAVSPTPFWAPSMTQHQWFSDDETLSMKLHFDREGKAYWRDVRSQPDFDSTPVRFHAFDDIRYRLVSSWSTESSIYVMDISGNFYYTIPLNRNIHSAASFPLTTVGKTAAAGTMGFTDGRLTSITNKSEECETHPFHLQQALYRLFSLGVDISRVRVGVVANFRDISETPVYFNADRFIEFDLSPQTSASEFLKGEYSEYQLPPIPLFRFEWYLGP
jgi:hypothetical protein